MFSFNFLPTPSFVFSTFFIGFFSPSLLFIKSNETNFGEYEGNAKNGYLIGAGGSSYFKFENLNNNTKEVEVAINFEYKRTWELAAIQDFTANVTLA